MAGAYKTSKSELVSIYRLEFYKKQKNWKFCSTERKKEEERKKAAKNAKAKLNQTYSIEPAPEKDSNIAQIKTEEVILEEETDQLHLDTEEKKEYAEPMPTEEGIDNLNEAFVDTETDDNIPTQLDKPPTGPYNPRWSIQQWAARCRPWNCDPTPPQTQDEPSQHVQKDPSHHVQSDPTQPYYVQKDPSHHVQSDPTLPYHVQSDPSHLVPSDPSHPYHVPSDPMQLYCIENSMVQPGYEADLIYKRMKLPHSGTNMPHEANISDTDEIRDWQQPGGWAGGWPRCTQVWTNRQEAWFEEICDIPEEAIEAIEALEVGEAGDAVDGGAGRALLRQASDWLRSSSSLDKGACNDSLASISSGSFTRGAAMAPHSSEQDLSAAALPAAALAAAVAGHAAALAALLGEARRRGQQVSPPPTAQLHSFDEYPTHDTGLSPHIHNETPLPTYTHTPTPSSVYTHNPTFVNDVFVAGSFKNRPDLSGQTESRGRGRKVRVIGIEMGRPYRL